MVQTFIHYPSGAWDGEQHGGLECLDPLDHPLPQRLEEVTLVFKPTTAFMTGATRLAAHFHC